MVCECRQRRTAAHNGPAWALLVPLTAELILVITSGLCFPRGAAADSSFKQIAQSYGSVRSSPSIGMQVVHDVAATEDENAFSRKSARRLPTS